MLLHPTCGTELAVWPAGGGRFFEDAQLIGIAQFPACGCTGLVPRWVSPEASHREEAPTVPGGTKPPPPSVFHVIVTSLSGRLCLTIERSPRPVVCVLLGTEEGKLSLRAGQ